MRCLWQALFRHEGCVKEWVTEALRCGANSVRAGSGRQLRRLTDRRRNTTPMAVAPAPAANSQAASDERKSPSEGPPPERGAVNFRPKPSSNAMGG